VRELLAALARSLVEEPDLVRVTELEVKDGILLELEVAAEDRGKVIGKRGRTAEALRVLLGAVGERRGMACRMEILD
jgi:predicted RNA-binding protein YlqC (UPF0109 family)